MTYEGADSRTMERPPWPHEGKLGGGPRLRQGLKPRVAGIGGVNPPTCGTTTTRALFRRFRGHGDPTILRHAEVSTTARYYIKTAADDVKHAIEKLESNIPQAVPAFAAVPRKTVSAVCD